MIHKSWKTFYYGRTPRSADPCSLLPLLIKYSSRIQLGYVMDRLLSPQTIKTVLFANARILSYNCHIIWVRNQKVLGLYVYNRASMGLSHPKQSLKISNVCARWVIHTDYPAKYKTFSIIRRDEDGLDIRWLDV